MVNGTDTSDLESGPGLYRGTTFPGIAGTTLIAGHRTTYLAPFRHIDSLRPGQQIRLEMPYGRFLYTVIGHRVVAPTNVKAATANVGYSRLVLSACTPLFSAEKRLLVFGRLTRAEPLGPGRYLTGGQVAQPLALPAASRDAAPATTGARIPRPVLRRPGRLAVLRPAAPRGPRRSS